MLEPSVGVDDKAFGSIFTSVLEIAQNKPTTSFIPISQTILLQQR